MEPKIKVSLRVEMPGAEHEVRHDINVELDLSTGNGIFVKGNLPGTNTDSGNPMFIEARGKNVLGAVLEWLSVADRMPFYTPAYKKAEREK